MKNSVPRKNYIALVIMIIAVVILTFLIFGLNKKYNNKKLEKSNFDNYVNKVSLEEISDILNEPSSELFIFITKTGDEQIYNEEGKLKNIIKKYDLRDNFIYIDYTDYDDLKELNDKFKTEINTIPALLFYRNGALEKVVESKDVVLSSEFQKLLDEYEISE